MQQEENNRLKFYSVGDDEDEWERLRSECPHFSPKTKTIKMLRSGLDGHVKVVVLERSYICKDHRNLHSRFLSKKFRDRPSHCSRLHFFSSEQINRDSLFRRPIEAQDHYLGFSVIRPIPERELGRTVIDAEKMGLTHEGGAYYMRTRFRANLNGVDLYLQGFPFMTQDVEATGCSHAALWGICRYLSQRYSEYSEFRPYDLVLRTSPERGRVIPYRGMTHADYATILADFGCHPVSFTTRVGEDSFLDVCAYVESGIPVVASMQNQKDGPGHVVNLIGHTTNENQSFRRKGFFHETPAGETTLHIADSAAFLDSFIINDDNLFPYRNLGFEGLGRTDHYLKSRNYDIEKIHTVVAPLPEKVYLSASLARKVAYTVLEELAKDEKVRDQFLQPKDNHLITRLFFTTSRAFKARKLENFKKMEMIAF